MYRRSARSQAFRVAMKADAECLRHEKDAMARFIVEDQHLIPKLSPLEAVGGLRRSARVPLTDVASVEVTPEPWKVPSGLRVGTGLPGAILLGTMIRRGANDVVAIYGRAPAVVVTLREGAAWRRLIATVPHPDAVAAQIQDAMRD